MSKINVKFNVYSDTPKNKDPDTNSPTLRKYHQILWSKELPSKDSFELDLSIPKYLHHESDLGNFILSSDSICHTYSNLKNMKEIISGLSKEELTTFYSLASTIGAYIIFPANRIKNKMTINGARGLNRQIKDRFDLTLLCIKKFYEQKDSPLDEVLKRYDNFFNLFKNFKGYVSFFLLNDLVNEDFSIRFFLPFKNFEDNPLPEDLREYLIYKKNVENFIARRNQRMLSSTINGE